MIPADYYEPSVELVILVALFYQDASELGEFERVTADEMPELYRKLLDHSNHMTVTVEAHHGQSVDVRVLRHHLLSDRYEREILLLGHNSQQIVQYGIVRLQPSLLRPDVWQAISGGQSPLGRVLIEHNVLRSVELVELWQVTCGQTLALLLGCPLGARTFGRTALLHCDGQPAIELLEIVQAAELLDKAI